jgi:hypothetical protein
VWIALNRISPFHCIYNLNKRWCDYEQNRRFGVDDEAIEPPVRANVHRRTDLRAGSPGSRRAFTMKTSRRRSPSTLICFGRGSKLVGGIAGVFGANEG